MISHHYAISALFSQTSIWGKTSGGVAACRLSHRLPWLQKISKKSATCVQKESKCPLVILKITVKNQAIELCIHSTSATDLSCTAYYCNVNLSLQNSYYPRYQRFSLRAVGIFGVGWRPTDLLTEKMETVLEKSLATRVNSYLKANQRGAKCDVTSLPW